MRRSLVAWIVLVLCHATLAHPGAGIVVRPDGTVCFTDISRRTIWEVAPDGERIPLVQGVWTHSIALAPDGALYYEREEPADGPAPNSFWRIAPGGKPERLIAPQPDRSVFGGSEFVIDSAGAVYFPHSVHHEGGGWRTRIMRRTPEGDSRPFTGLGDGALFTDGGANEATIRIVTAMAPGPNDSVYFADRDHIRRLETTGENIGRITTIASGLIDQDPRDPPHRRGPSMTINRLYGLAVDESGEVFVAYQAGRRVMRVSPEGELETLHESEGAWSPIGVALHSGEVYVLEVGDESIEHLRVLRIPAEGKAETVITLN
jgi:sugar lactone lactonase YvrE